MILHNGMAVRRLIAFFVLSTALAFAQERPLDNIGSRQYQHEIRPLRFALDRWLHELGFQDAGLNIRLVKASDLPPNSCGMSNYNVKSLIGEIDVLACAPGRRPLLNPPGPRAR